MVYFEQGAGYSSNPYGIMAYHLGTFLLDREAFLLGNTFTSCHKEKHAPRWAQAPTRTATHDNISKPSEPPTNPKQP